MDNQKLQYSADSASSKLTTTICLFEKVFNNTFCLKETIKTELEDTRIAGDDLFSFFTANIIKQRQIFTR
ncbi:MAG: hypothetical protein ABIN67_19540 [Ferruginibacter sp.]